MRRLLSLITLLGCFGLFGLPSATAAKGDPIGIHRNQQAWTVESFTGKRQTLGGEKSEKRTHAVTFDEVSVRLIDAAVWKQIGQQDPSQKPETNIDVLCLDGSVEITSLTENQKRWLSEAGPKRVLCESEKTAAVVAEGIGIEDAGLMKRSVFAWKQDDDAKIEAKVFVLPVNKPLPKEMEQLFEKMETACKASQATFRELSAEQLNFRPPNGTHTPRWNAEHMMGRELVFFSQIYHAIDPMVPIYNWNPKQMPPEYVADKPEWDGEKEAERMEQVSRFARRYADWLRDVDLDKRAPGSRWTLRGLLRQMDRHYTEHTANVKKKMKLPEWPK